MKKLILKDNTSYKELVVPTDLRKKAEDDGCGWSDNYWMLRDAFYDKGYRYYGNTITPFANYSTDEVFYEEWTEYFYCTYGSFGSMDLNVSFNKATPKGKSFLRPALWIELS